MENGTASFEQDLDIYGIDQKEKQGKSNDLCSAADRVTNRLKSARKCQDSERDDLRNILFIDVFLRLIDQVKGLLCKYM